LRRKRGCRNDEQPGYVIMKTDENVRADCLGIRMIAEELTMDEEMRKL
jgi:hypothetical protein